MREDRLDDMGVIVDAELVGHREQKRVGFGDGIVLGELLDQNIRLGGVAAAEHGAPVVAEEADGVFVLAAVPEIGTVPIVHQREMLRLTETRGSRVCPAAFQASRYFRIWPAC